jgi:hypothetical protein
MNVKIKDSLWILLVACLVGVNTGCHPSDVYVNNGADAIEADEPGFLLIDEGELFAAGDALQAFLTPGPSGEVLTGWIAVEEEGFDAVAFQFDASSTPEVDVRTSPNGGETWSEWSAGTIIFNEMFAHNAVAEVLPGTHVQIRFRGVDPAVLAYLRVTPFLSLDAEEANDADLVPLTVVDTEDDEGLQQRTQGLSAHRGVDVTRQQWGARPHHCTARNNPNRVVIHHTAGPNNDRLAQDARARQDQHYAQVTKKFCDGMYHFLIGQDGLIYESRPARLRGAHALAANVDSLGIAFLGNYSNVSPSEAMMNAAARLLKGISEEHGIPLNRTTVKGHREVGDTPTQCPGNVLFGRLPELVNRSAASSSGSVAAVGPSGCTAQRENDCAAFGCGCVDGECSGGHCPGTGCTTTELGTCAAQGCGCADGSCSGGTCAGTGCTAKMARDCAARGCQCVDGTCSGGSCGEPQYEVATRFSPVTPYRSNDTRIDSGGRLAAGTARMFDLARAPAGAAAVTANIAVVRPDGAGHIIAYPCGKRPAVSNLNFAAGETRAVQVTAALSAQGKLCIYSSRAVDIVIDISGWWISGGSLEVEPWAPARLADTRSGDMGGKLTPGSVAELDLSGINWRQAEAVSLNVTSTNADGAGYLTVYPCSAPRPHVSTLNFNSDMSRANHVTVSARRVCIFGAGSATDVVVDLTAIWSPLGEQTMSTHEPTRVFDSRSGGRIQGGTVRQIHPAADGVIVGGVTVVGANAPGYASVFSCDDNDLGASTVNYSAERASANAVVIDASKGGICVKPSANVHVIFDTFGKQR